MIQDPILVTGYSPIIITGCARSGTSLTAGIINNSGAWGGDIQGFNKHNAKGFFENKAIRNNIVKPYLKSIGCDPLGQFPLPNDKHVFSVNKEIANQWRLKIISEIKSQGYDGESIWFYKGAKVCLLWYLWHQAFPQAKWVLVRRNALDIISSCMRTGFMKAYQNVEGWAKWVKHHEDRFDEMKFHKIDLVEIWPQKMINGDYSEIESVLGHIGLKYDKQIVDNFISPELWRGGKDGK